MWDKFIGEQVRRTNRNLLLVNLFLVISFGMLTISQHKLLKSYFLGATKVEPAELAKAELGLERDIVEVNNPAVMPSGYRTVVRKGGGEDVKAEYLLMKVGDRMMIVKTQAGNKGPQFKGVVGPMDLKLSLALQKDIKSDAVRERLLPVMLDTTDYDSDVLGYLVVGLPLGLLGVWNLKKWMNRAADPVESPVVKQLEHRGGLMACQQIDCEMAQSSGRIGKAILTKSWILVPGFFSLKAMHIEDVVWAYKKVTRHRVNFVPVGSTYTAVVCTANGKSVEVLDSDAKVKELLVSIAVKAPWAITGFNDDVQTLWLKNRDALLLAVNQRRSALAKKTVVASATPAPAPA